MRRNRFILRAFVAFPLVLALVSSATVAHATPRPPNPLKTWRDFVKCWNNFHAARFWHAIIHLTGRTITVDYAAPDRWRMRFSSHYAIAFIGNTEYVETKAGVARGTARESPSQLMMRDWFALTPALRSTLRDGGTQMLGGVKVHVYTFSAAGALKTLYVGSNSYPVALKTLIPPYGTDTVYYSRFNVPVAINP